MSASHEPRWDRAASERVLARPPLPRSVEGPAGAVSVVYLVQEHDWWLWWRCSVCGGATLPLQHGGSLNRMRREGIIGRRVPGCPRCETQRRRLMTPDARPAVWYDTGVRDWVVQLPAASPEAGVVLPLGFGWFDSPWPEIYRAAADLAYAGDMFEDAPT